MIYNGSDVYIFNPAYVLKNDLRRVVIFSGASSNDLSVRDWESYLHPLHAKIFSFFTFNQPLNTTIALLSQYLRRTEEAVKDIVFPFIENPLSVYTKYNEDKIWIPKNVIINRKRIKNKVNYLKLTPDVFNCSSIDVTSRRMYMGPTLLTLMLNNTCVTDCIYCYADTKTSCTRKLSTRRILELLDEAYTMQVRAVNLMGGEVFLHPDWFIILKKLTDLNIAPEYISSKYPINNEIIDNIKKTGYRNPIQISLDTCSPDILKQTLSVKKDYVSKVIQGIRLLDKSGLNYRITSVITTYNVQNDIFNELANFISSLENITDWRITPAVNSNWIEYSCFKKLKPNKKDIESLYQYIESSIIPKLRIPVFLNRSAINREFHYCKTGSMDFKGVRCSALNNHMFILPDGKVTICEQLYWLPQFLIGNVSNNSIKEVWNSKRAKELSNLRRDDIRSGSPCKDCTFFESCFAMNNRCWVDIIKVYGKENWDFPDPRCAFAPPLTYNIGY